MAYNGGSKGADRRDAYSGNAKNLTPGHEDFPKKISPGKPALGAASGAFRAGRQPPSVPAAAIPSGPRSSSSGYHSYTYSPQQGYRGSSPFTTGSIVTSASQSSGDFLPRTAATSQPALRPRDRVMSDKAFTLALANVHEAQKSGVATLIKENTDLRVNNALLKVNFEGLVASHTALTKQVETQVESVNNVKAAFQRLNASQGYNEVHQTLIENHSVEITDIMRRSQLDIENLAKERHFRGAMKATFKEEVEKISSHNMNASIVAAKLDAVSKVNEQLLEEKATLLEETTKLEAKNGKLEKEKAELEQEIEKLREENKKLAEKNWKLYMVAEQDDKALQKQKHQINWLEAGAENRAAEKKLSLDQIALLEEAARTHDSVTTAKDAEILRLKNIEESQVKSLSKLAVEHKSEVQALKRSFEDQLATQEDKALTKLEAAHQGEMEALKQSFEDQLAANDTAHATAVKQNEAAIERHVQVDRTQKKTIDEMDNKMECLVKEKEAAAKLSQIDMQNAEDIYKKAEDIHKKAIGEQNAQIEKLEQEKGVAIKDAQLAAADMEKAKETLKKILAENNTQIESLEGEKDAAAHVARIAAADLQSQVLNLQKEAQAQKEDHAKELLLARTQSVDNPSSLDVDFTPLANNPPVQQPRQPKEFSRFSKPSIVMTFILALIFIFGYVLTSHPHVLDFGSKFQPRDLNDWWANNPSWERVSAVSNEDIISIRCRLPPSITSSPTTPFFPEPARSFLDQLETFSKPTPTPAPIQQQSVLGSPATPIFDKASEVSFYGAESWIDLLMEAKETADEYFNLTQAKLDILQSPLSRLLSRDDFISIFGWVSSLVDLVKSRI